MRKLKGVCRIELTDVKTGEKKVTVDENVVTNAINQLFGLPLKYAPINTNPRYAIYPEMTPLTDLFKGVVLLKNVISGTDEQLKANVDLPIGGAVTAHAGSSTSLPDGDLTCGVFNEEESGAVEAGYKYVWDFPTDRGNGDIYCVCLTSADGGTYLPVSGTYKRATSREYLYKLYGSATLSYYYTTNDERYPYYLSPIGIYDDKFICIRPGSNAEAFYTVDLDPAINMTSNLFGANTDINGGVQSVKHAYSDARAVEHSVSTGIAGKVARYCDNYIWQLSGTTLKKIDPATYQQTGSDIAIPFTAYVSGNIKGWYIKNNYFYGIDTSDHTKIKKVNLSDVTDITTITVANQVRHIVGEISGKLLVANSVTLYHEQYGISAYLIDNDEAAATVITYSGSSGSQGFGNIVSIPGSSIYYLLVNGGGYALYRHKFPAMTIDNLQTPVTKTNATTMKVIYTITDESEEEEE